MPRVCRLSVALGAHPRDKLRCDCERDQRRAWPCVCYANNETFGECWPHEQAAFKSELYGEFGRRVLSALRQCNDRVVLAQAYVASRTDHGHRSYLFSDHTSAWTFVRLVVSYGSSWQL